MLDIVTNEEWFGYKINGRFPKYEDSPEDSYIYRYIRHIKLLDFSDYWDGYVVEIIDLDFDYVIEVLDKDLKEVAYLVTYTYSEDVEISLKLGRSEIRREREAPWWMGIPHTTQLSPVWG